MSRYDDCPHDRDEDMSKIWLESLTEPAHDAYKPAQRRQEDEVKQRRMDRTSTVLEGPGGSQSRDSDQEQCGHQVPSAWDVASVN